MKIPDQNDKDEQNIEYSFQGLKIHLDNLQAALKFDRKTGVNIAAKSTGISVSGNLISDQNRRVQLFATTFSIKAIVAVKDQESGHLTLSMDKCEANVGDFKENIETRGIIERLKKFFFYRKPSYFFNQMICSQLKEGLAALNLKLGAMKVPVGEHMIDCSLMSAVISDTSIEIGIKSVFIPEQSPKPIFHLNAFSLVPQNNKMFYIAISDFTINSAFLVFHNTGVFNIRITDDMVPSISPFRLSTTTFGAFIPEISQTYPDVKLELEVKTVKAPAVKFEANHVIIQLISTMTAFQSGNTQTQLFVLNLEVIADAEVTKDKQGFDLTLQKVDVSMNNNKYKITTQNKKFLIVITEGILFPIIKAHLAKGFSLPGLLGATIGVVHLVNSQAEVLKDYVLIGTDIQLGENNSS